MGPELQQSGSLSRHAEQRRKVQQILELSRLAKLEGLAPLDVGNSDERIDLKNRASWHVFSEENRDKCNQAKLVEGAMGSEHLARKYKWNQAKMVAGAMGSEHLGRKYKWNQAKMVAGAMGAEHLARKYQAKMVAGAMGADHLARKYCSSSVIV